MSESKRESKKRFNQHPIDDRQPEYYQNPRNFLEDIALGTDIDNRDVGYNPDEFKEEPVDVHGIRPSDGKVDSFKRKVTDKKKSKKRSRANKKKETKQKETKQKETKQKEKKQRRLYLSAEERARLAREELDVKRDYNTLRAFDEVPEYSEPVGPKLLSGKFKIKVYPFNLIKRKRTTPEVAAYSFFKQYQKWIRTKPAIGSKPGMLVINLGLGRSVSRSVARLNNIRWELIHALIDASDTYGGVNVNNMDFHVRVFGRHRGSGVAPSDKRNCIYNIKTEKFCGLKSLVILLELANDKKTLTQRKSRIKYILRLGSSSLLLSKAIDLGKQMWPETYSTIDISTSNSNVNNSHIPSQMTFADFNRISRLDVCIEKAQIHDMKNKLSNGDENCKRAYQVIIFTGPKDLPWIGSLTCDCNDVVQLFVYYNRKYKHYSPINNINAFLRSAPCNDSNKKRNTNMSWCCKCCSVIDRRSLSDHKCPGRMVCNYCKTVFKTDAERREHIKYQTISDVNADSVVCGVCHAEMPYGENCRRIHEKTCVVNSTTCDKCNATYKTFDAFDNPYKHSCTDEYCYVCCRFVSDDHICMISPRKKNEVRNRRVKNVHHFVYDIESMLCPPDDCGEQRHIPYMICTKSLDSSKYKVFEYTRNANDSGLINLTDPASDFLNWAKEYTIKNKCGLKLWAHNAQGYDSFLLRWHMEHVMGIVPDKLLLRGQKVLYMRMARVEFVDSMAHISGSLDSLIDTFSLLPSEHTQENKDETSFKRKTVFPYTFLTPSTCDWVGAFSDIPEDHFQTEAAKKYRKKHLDNSFDMRIECRYYCLNDCEILKRALLKYKEHGICANGINPLDSVTISSYAQKVFLTNHYTVPMAILSYDIHEFIQQSFFGGRTEVFRLRARVTANTNKVIKYVDISSMYPAVMAQDMLPYGGAEWFSGKLCDVADDEFAFIECELNCPLHINLPVLMERCPRTKRTIARTGDMTGVFTSAELSKAVSLGYVIKSVKRGVKFKAARGVFESYVNKFYTGKAKAKKEKNSGMYVLCKMMLNSLWGKFSQKQINTKNEYVSDIGRWENIIDSISDGNIELKDMHIISPHQHKHRLVSSSSVLETSDDKHIELFDTFNSLDSLFIQTELVDDTFGNVSKIVPRNTNIAIASAITSCARLRLYKAMEACGNNLCYVDTDSCIYIDSDDTLSNENNDNISQTLDVKPAGCAKLGEWEMEAELEEYVAVGPKSYAFRDNKGTEVVRCKGFRPSWITFDMYSDMVSNMNKSYDCEETRFVRGAKGMTTIKGIKSIGSISDNFTKRAILSDGTTAPLRENSC